MKTIYIILSILFLASCSPAYIPNMVNAPIFSNKNELQIKVNGSSGGVDPQLSYAITNHLGVMVNGNFGSYTDENTGITTRHKFAEIGAGYYTNNKGRFVFAFFGGAGAGETEGEFETDNGLSITQASLNRIFVQPAIGWVTDIFDFSLATRFSHVNLSPQLQSPLNTSSLMFEPALNLGLGYKYVKLHTQLGFSVPMGDPNNLGFSYQPVVFGIGLTARIGRKYF